MLTLIVCVTWISFATAQRSASVLVEVDKPIGKVSPTLVGFTFDWWKKTDPTYGKKWETAGILTADLNNPNLIKLTAGLAPSILRIGGSPEDSITYNVTGTECTSSQQPKPSSSYYCSQVHPSQYGCLSMNRWAQIIDFAKKTQSQLAFGLNACFGRTNATCPESMTNIEALVKYTMTHFVDGVYAFELGNELDRTINPKTWAADLIHLKGIVDDLWKDSPHKPMLVGPDTGISQTYFKELLQTIIDQGGQDALHALTYHQYVNCGLQSSGTVFDLGCLERVQSEARALKMLVANYSSSIDLWIGESAEHSGGGIYGQTNTFASSFYYTYQLSEAAVNGLGTAARQCLMGGYYELINKTTFEPNPDYWVAYMFRQFIGSDVFEVTSNPKNPPSLYFKAFSGKAPNSLVFVIINFDQDAKGETNLGVTINSNRAFKFEEYHLTGDVRESVVYLNGKPLEFHGSFPNLEGVRGNNQIKVKPKSVVFVNLTPL